MHTDSPKLHSGDALSEEQKENNEAYLNESSFAYAPGKALAEQTIY